MRERTYRIHVAAALSGVSEGLIRAWERRYGALKPRRTRSGYRSYTEGDIEILRRLKQLTREGVAIADAVRLLPEIRRELRSGARPAPPRAEQLQRWQEAALAAAGRLDQQAVERVLDEAVGQLPPLAYFDDLLVPLLREVGERWHRGTLTIAEEHLVTQAVRQRVFALLSRAPQGANQHVVCACFPHEDHELGLMGAAIRFRHEGWRVTFLGARTPIDHLARSVRALEPDAVALSAISDEGADAFRRTLCAVIEALPGKTRLVVGGAAAARHAAIAEQLGARVVHTKAHWAAVVGA